MIVRPLPFSLVDVFAPEPLAGNGLAVFLLDSAVPKALMQRIAQEMRQFETIFLLRTDRPGRFSARIFTMEEELPFAGHPVIGAAAWVHATCFPAEESVSLEFLLAERTVSVESVCVGDHRVAAMAQGRVAVAPPLPDSARAEVAAALALDVCDLAVDLPMQVVSTGLPYLIVPVQSGLERARIVDPDFSARLAGYGASFVYVLDVGAREGRTWDNAGRVEDIATGSAAGPVGAYLVTHGLTSAGPWIDLAQGRFVGRPSRVQVVIDRAPEGDLNACVRGQVCLAGDGQLRVPEAWCACSGDGQ